MRTLRSLFGHARSLGHHERDAQEPPDAKEEGSTLPVRAARDVVKGDHLDKIVELVKAPEDVDACSTILKAAAPR